MYQLLIREIRVRDLVQISTFLGEDESIKTIEIVLEAFYAPLLAVCQVFSNSDHVTCTEGKYRRFFETSIDFFVWCEENSRIKKSPKRQAIRDVQTGLKLLHCFSN